MRRNLTISTVGAAIAGAVVLGSAAPASAQHDPQHDQPGQQRGTLPQLRGDRARGAPPSAPPHQPVHAQPRPAPAPPPSGGWRGTPPPAPPPPPAAVNHPAPPRYAPPARPAAEARAWHDQGHWRQGAWPQHPTWGEHRARDWNADHRRWEQRGGYGGTYIPADRFERRFGPRHHFRLHVRPVIVDGYPRFRYGGYNFLIVDPWPASWDDGWYQSDDLYISYEGDGYYLHNRRDPDVGLAVVATL